MARITWPGTNFCSDRRRLVFPPIFCGSMTCKLRPEAQGVARWQVIHDSHKMMKRLPTCLRRNLPALWLDLLSTTSTGALVRRCIPTAGFHGDAPALLWNAGLLI